MFSQRAQTVTPFLVMEILERAQEIQARGREVIHLEVGEPDFPTPSVVCEAGIRAIREGRTRYTHSLGLLPLREAIAEWYGRHYGVEVTPDRILVTPGTSPALLLVLCLLLDPGDEVLMGDPHYACYPNTVRMAGGRPVTVPAPAERGFQPDPADLAARLTGRTKAILVNSPSNPAGTLLAPEALAAVAELGPLVISDEIYHGLVYAGRARSVLEFTDHAVVINGFSKLFAMTGWRLGYAILPRELVRPIRNLQQNFVISAADFVQWAGLAALREAGAAVQEMVATYDRRRRFLVPRLREMGFGVTVEPTGAFYVLADARPFGSDSLALARTLLEETGVAVTPGIDFGPSAEGHLRFSYANGLDRIREGLDRIHAFLRREGRA